MSTTYHHIKHFIDQQPNIVRTLQKSSSPNILFSSLPKHWRSNKSFQDPFVVVILTPVPDKTEVSIWAGNDEAPCGEIRNEKAVVERQVAKFNDIRFIGRSGRGRKFHLTIVVHSTPMMVATGKSVIKVTVDGPRDARVPKQSISGAKTPNPIMDVAPSQTIVPSIPLVAQWPWPFLTTHPISPFMIPTTSCPTIFPSAFPQPCPIIHGKRKSPLSENFQTPTKNNQENECLNTSTGATSPLQVTPSSNQKTGHQSPDLASPSTISLTQSTPDSLPSKRRRTESTTSSNGSSPTIWRPF